MKCIFLLQQIGMTDDQFAIHFEQAELNRVNIHRKSRLWQFNLTLEKPLPASCLSSVLATSERSIFCHCDGRLEITCRSTEVDEALLTDYWPFIIEEISDMSPPIRERLMSQKPVMTGGKMMLLCTNDMELQTLKGKYADLIADVYRSFGFTRPFVDFKLTEEDSGAEARV